MAISLVLLWHLYGMVQHPKNGLVLGALDAVAQQGWTGVPLFFALSGFLIGRILIRHRSSPEFLRAFFVRRFCRIVPVYFLFLAIMALGAAFVRTEPDIWPPDRHASVPGWSYWLFLQNIFMAQNNSFGAYSFTWSLAVEEQFYLFMPLLVRLVPPRRLHWFLLTGIMACWLFRYVALEHGTTAIALMVVLPMRMDGLLWGVFLAWAWDKPAVRAWLERRAWWIWIGGLLALMLCLGQRWVPTPIMYMVLGYTMLAWFFTSCLHAALSARVRSWRVVLEWAPLVVAGRWSYFVFLFHMPIVKLLSASILGRSPQMTDLAGVGIALATLVLVFALAAASWRWVEAPLLAWGSRWRYEGGRPIAPDPIRAPASA